MNAVPTAVLPVFALILVGYGCGRGRIFGPGATDSLNLFVVWLALPAVLFQGMAGISWDTLDHPGFVAAFCGGAGASFALAMWTGNRRHRDGRHGRRPLADASVEGLAAGYSNTGFMGIPLCLATFGPAGLPPAIVGTLLTASVLFAGGIVLIEIDLNRDRHIGRTLGRVALSLLRNPLILAPAFGLLYAATGLPLPASVDRFASLLAGSASPCALVTIGLFLAQGSGPTRNPVDRWAVGRLVALKLLVQPSVTGLLAFGLALPTVWAQAALLLAALPTGTGPFMLAKLYGREPEITSEVILVSTMISVVTISGLVAWFGRG